MESDFWKPENLRFAVSFTAILYFVGIYIFMLPAYLERRKHPRSTRQPPTGLIRRTDLYTLIFALSPLIFLIVIFGGLLWGVMSLFSIVMLMVMSPFHWLFSQLPTQSHAPFSMARWRRLSGRMFEYSRKMLLWLAGEPPLREIEALKDSTGEK